MTSHSHDINLPNIGGTPPKRRMVVKGVIDDTGKMYVFGGFADECTCSPEVVYFNDVVILNTGQLVFRLIHPWCDMVIPQYSCMKATYKIHS